MTTPWYVFVALSISVLAFVVASLNYRRKAGVLIYGNWTCASSRDCNDKYIASITLENLKDRAITIFAIYLRIGHNYYILIEKFDDRPLILKAFETYNKEYGPIQFYGVNTNRIILDPLFDDKKVKKRIVLSTSDGKYVIQENIMHWNPAGEFFQNYWTAIINPVRTLYKEIPIGANIKYVIEFTGDNNKEETITVHPEDYHLVRFRIFSLTRESLVTKETLTEYLNLQISNGKLNCKHFQVYDADLWKGRTAEFYNGQTIHAQYISYLRYKIFGRIYTWNSNRNLTKQNKKRLKK
jgi:hypothetical protein